MWLAFITANSFSKSTQKCNKFEFFQFRNAIIFLAQTEQHFDTSHDAAAEMSQCVSVIPGPVGLQSGWWFLPPVMTTFFPLWWCRWRKAKWATQKIKPLSENITWNRRRKNRKTFTCRQPEHRFIKQSTFPVRTAHVSVQRRRGLKGRQMSLGCFFLFSKSSTTSIQPHSTPLHLCISRPPPVCISIWKQSTIRGRVSNENKAFSQRVPGRELREGENEAVLTENCVGEQRVSLLGIKNKTDENEPEMSRCQHQKLIIESRQRRKQNACVKG